LLQAPKRLLNIIEFEGTCVEMSFPTFGEDPPTDCKKVLWMVFDILTRCFGEEKPFYARSIFVEALMNAAEHGNQWDCQKKILAGIWIGKKGVLFGVKDEGDFFTKESTREMIRRRRLFPSTAKIRCGGVGMLGIYQASNIWLRDGAIFFTVLLREKTKSS